jgi:streptogramin lyase
MTCLTCARLALVLAAISFVAQRAAAATSPLLYASAIDSVDVFAQDPRYALPVAQLTAASGASAPAGLTVDPNGDVWVTNSGYNTGTANGILEYLPGASEPSFEITESPQVAPTNVAVGSDGVVYVVNYGGGNVNNYSIAAFAPGKQMPFERLSGLGYIAGIAVDKQNDLYVAHSPANSNYGRIARFKPQHTQGEDLGIKQGYGAVLIDPHGDIVALDQSARTVNVYAPGTTKPERSFRVNALLFAAGSIALDGAGARLYVAVGGGFCCGPSGIYVFDYPTGRQIGDIVAGFPASYPPAGLAVSPRS